MILIAMIVRREILSFASGPKERSIQDGEKREGKERKIERENYEYQDGRHVICWIREEPINDSDIDLQTFLPPHITTGKYIFIHKRKDD